MKNNNQKKYLAKAAIFVPYGICEVNNDEKSQPHREGVVGIFLIRVLKKRDLLDAEV